MKKIKITCDSTCDLSPALYEKYGYYRECTVDIYMEGLDGIEKRRRVMSALRENTPVEFGGYRVVSYADYQSGVVTSLCDGSISKTGQPSSDVLYYTLENDDKIIVRPSGTEPKIKIYILAHDDNREALDKKTEIYQTVTKRIAEA